MENMTGTGLSASDVLAMTKDNDGFGGVGLIILLFIFLIGIGGNGFGWGNNNTATALSLADIQASLYNQTQDSNSRQTQNQIAMVNDTVLNNKYDNAVLIKDLSNQNVDAEKAGSFIKSALMGTDTIPTGYYNKNILWKE